MLQVSACLVLILRDVSQLALGVTGEDTGCEKVPRSLRLSLAEGRSGQAVVHPIARGLCPHVSFTLSPPGNSILFVINPLKVLFSYIL